MHSALCRDIDLGIYKSGEQIPAEGYLCEKFHVSRVTVRNIGQEVQRYRDTFDVHFADKEEGKWLLCPAHTALLGVSQIVYGVNNKVLYYNEQYIRSDIYKYVTGR